MPEISIIIPVYNVEKYLKTCVESILSQDFSDFEIILIDDKSPDSSGKMCDEFTDNRIKVIHLEKNGGLSNARNIGINAAAGKYIIFIDSDDSITPKALSKIYATAQETGCDEVIFGYNIVLERNGKTFLNTPVFAENALLDGQEQIAGKLLELKEKVLIDPSWNKLFKKEIITENNISMPVGEIFEDTQFNLNLLPHINKIAIICDCFYNYMQRNSGGSITKSYNPKKLEFLKKRSQTLNNYFKNSNMWFGETEKRCNYLHIKYIFSSLIDLNFPNSGYSFTQKINSIKAEIKDENFLKAVNNVTANDKFGKIVIAFAKTKNAYLIYILCKLIYLIKYKLQKFFFKLKKL